MQIIGEKTYYNINIKFIFFRFFSELPSEGNGTKSQSPSSSPNSALSKSPLTKNRFETSRLKSSDQISETTKSIFIKSFNSSKEKSAESSASIKSSQETDLKPVPKFNLNREVSVHHSSKVSSHEKGPAGLPKPFTADAIDTFIDAECSIDYGSLATTLPIDVDEALGALDSLKFLRSDEKSSTKNWMKNYQRFESTLKLNCSVANKQREINLWQSRNPFELKKTWVLAKSAENTETEVEAAETPICPIIVESLSSLKTQSADDLQNLPQGRKVNVEIIKGDEIEHEVSQQVLPIDQT